MLDYAADLLTYSDACLRSMARLVQVVWEKYIEAMQVAGFNPHQGLYIASGLLTYGASEGEPSSGRFLRFKFA